MNEAYEGDFIDIMLSYTVQPDNSSIICRQNFNHMLDKLRSCQFETTSLIGPFSLFDNFNVSNM